jgi:uncharacterized protein YdcH (DUF465 family)
MDYHRIIALHKKLSKRIKQYENKLPFEVQSEIRYAFRAEMQIVEENLKEDSDPTKIDEAGARLLHALMCAYHDLLDGVVIDCSCYLDKFATEWSEASIRVLGAKRREIINDLREAEKLIEDSRGNLDGREDTYEALYDEHFARLLDHRKYLDEEALEDVILEHRRITKRRANRQNSRDHYDRRIHYCDHFVDPDLIRKVGGRAQGGSALGFWMIESEQCSIKY